MTIYYDKGMCGFFEELNDDDVCEAGCTKDDEGNII